MNFKIDFKTLRQGLKQEIAAQIAEDFLKEDQDELTQYKDPFEVRAFYTLNDFFLEIRFEIKGFFDAPCTFCLESKKFPLLIDTTLELPIEEMPDNGDFDLMPLLREAILLDTPTFVECCGGACPERASCAQYLVPNERRTLYEEEATESQPLSLSGEPYGRTP